MLRLEDHQVASYVFQREGHVVKSVSSTDKFVSYFEREIKYLQLLQHEKWVPKIIELKRSNHKIELTMEKLGMSVYDWIQTDPHLSEWLSFYRQFFDILDKLHSKYHILHNDLHSKNLMWRNKRLCVIDFGLSKPFVTGTAHFDYGNLITIYNQKYGINKQSVRLALKKRGITGESVWEIIDNVSKVEKLFNDKVLDIEDVDHFVFPPKIRKYVHYMFTSFGQSSNKYLQKYFPFQYTLNRLYHLQPATYSDIQEKTLPAKYDKTLAKYNGISLYQVTMLLKVLLKKHNLSQINLLDVSSYTVYNLIVAVALQVNTYHAYEYYMDHKNTAKSIIKDYSNGGDYTYLADNVFLTYDVILCLNGNGIVDYEKHLLDNGYIITTNPQIEGQCRNTVLIKTLQLNKVTLFIYQYQLRKGPRKGKKLARTVNKKK
jgi:serine/threonine-protein kinase RIO1